MSGAPPPSCNDGRQIGGGAEQHPAVCRSFAIELGFHLDACVSSPTGTREKKKIYLSISRDLQVTPRKDLDAKRRVDCSPIEGLRGSKTKRNRHSKHFACSSQDYRLLSVDCSPS